MRLGRIARAAMVGLLALAPGLSQVRAADFATNYGTATGNAVVKALSVDATGNVYLAGHFDGATLAIGSVTLPRIGSQDAFVAKLDSSGATIWASNFGGIGAAAHGNGIAVDSFGTVHLRGGFANADLTTPALTKIGVSDVFAVKLDSSGGTIWAANFGGAGASLEGQGMGIDGAGNTYLGGTFGSADLTTPALARIGIQDAFVLKLDSSGSVTWARSFGGPGASTFGSALAVDVPGNVYLGGSFNGANLTTPALARIGTQDAIAFKLDSSGNTTWARNFSDAFYSAGSGIAVDGAGNVHLVGGFAIPGGLDAFARKLDASGNTIWRKRFGGYDPGSRSFANTHVQGVATDAAGNVYLGGHFSNRNLDTPFLDLIGSQDAFAIKLDPAGTTISEKNFGGSAVSSSGFALVYAHGYAIAADSSGNILLGGSFQGGDLTTPALAKIGVQDALVVAVPAPDLRISQTISFGSAPSVVVGGTGPVSATATSGLPVTFTSATPAVCTVSGSTVVGIAIGTCTIAADQPGNSAYFAASQVAQSFAVLCIASQPGDCDNDGIPNAVEATEARDPLVKDNDIFSPGPVSARLFAMQQFRDFVGQEGDVGSLYFWATAIANGTFTRAQAIEAFINTPQFAGVLAPVTRLYFATFLRIPDHAGVVFNASLVRDGVISLPGLANYFSAGPEFMATYGALTDTQFVTLLYDNVLGRAPDPEGLAGWVGFLASGYTRGQVLLGFSESPEYIAASSNEVFVTLAYLGMLRRSPDPAGFAGWVGVLDAGAYTREQAINGFVLSTEYYNRFLP